MKLPIRLIAFAASLFGLSLFTVPPQNRINPATPINGKYCEVWCLKSCKFVLSGAADGLYPNG